MPPNRFNILQVYIIPFYPLRTPSSIEITRDISTYGILLQRITQLRKTALAIEDASIESELDRRALLRIPGGLGERNGLIKPVATVKRKRAQVSGRTMGGSTDRVLSGLETLES